MADLAEIEARDTLKEWIEPDGSLKSKGYPGLAPLDRSVNWELRDGDTITLLGGFTAKELVALAWWMEHKANA